MISLNVDLSDSHPMMTGCWSACGRCTINGYTCRCTCDADDDLIAVSAICCSSTALVMQTYGIDIDIDIYF